LATIFFVSPTSSVSRIKLAAKNSTGFIYYVSLTGTTGQNLSLPKELLGNILLVKKYTSKPVCVGFGISSSKQVKELSRVADGVIVGSAIVSQIEKNTKSRNLIARVCGFVKKLKS